MDINKLTLLICLSILVVANCDYLEVKEMWDYRRTICGHTRIEDLSKSLNTELLNQPKATLKKLRNNKSTIAISYNDFRCCLKKTTVQSLDTDDKEIKCMEKLLQCIVKAQETPCTFKNEDYVFLAFSRTWMIVCLAATVYIILLSNFFLYYVHIYPRDTRVRRRRLENQ